MGAKRGYPKAPLALIKRVAEAAAAQGQTEVAAEIGIHPTNISDYKRAKGPVEMRSATLQKLRAWDSARKELGMTVQSGFGVAASRRGYVTVTVPEPLLKKLRRAMGIGGLSAVAKEAGIAKSTAFALRRGRRTVTPATLEKLKRWDSAVTVTDVLGGVEVPRKLPSDRLSVEVAGCTVEGPTDAVGRILSRLGGL